MAIDSSRWTETEMRLIHWPSSSSSSTIVQLGDHIAVVNERKGMEFLSLQANEKWTPGRGCVDTFTRWAELSYFHYESTDSHVPPSSRRRAPSQANWWLILLTSPEMGVIWHGQSPRMEKLEKQNQTSRNGYWKVTVNKVPISIDFGVGWGWVRLWFLIGVINHRKAGSKRVFIRK